MRFLDANILLRYATRDDPAKAAACAELMERLERGTEEVTTCEAVVAEVAYVLLSRAHYGLDHHQVRLRLAPFIGLRGLRLANKRVYLRALDIFAEDAALDFEDALAIAHMEADGIDEIYSYDQDFDRVEGIRRVEP